MPQRAARKGKPKQNPLLIHGELPYLLPLDVAFSIVTFLLVELTAQQKDFLLHHLFPILSPLCLLYFIEAMLVAKKDTTDLIAERVYHDIVTQWELHGKHGKRPESPTYRYHAFRTSTRDICTDEEILLYGGVKKLTIPQMIYLHLVHGAYPRLAQHTQSAHLDQRRTKGTTCWQLITKWKNTTSHLTEQQRAHLTLHLPSDSTTTHRARKRVTTSKAATPRKRARSNPASPSPVATSTPVVFASHMDSSFHSSTPLIHSYPQSSLSPQPHQSYPLSMTSAEPWKSIYDPHASESQSGFHQELDSIYGLPGMNQRVDEMEVFRGRTSFTRTPSFQTSNTDSNIVTIPPIPLHATPPSDLQAAVAGAAKAAAAAAASSFPPPSHPSIAHQQSIDLFLSPSVSSSSQQDDGDWNDHPGSDPLIFFDDISSSSPLLSPSFSTLSPIPTLFSHTELEPFDAFSPDL